MNAKVIIDALLGFIISFGGSVMVLLMQDGVKTLNDISQGAYITAFLAAAIATAKVLQSKLSDSPANIRQTDSLVAAAANLDLASKVIQ